MDSCPHGKDPDECLICWSEFNVEMEELRIEAGLTRDEFRRAIRECIAKLRSKSDSFGKDL